MSREKIRAGAAGMVLILFSLVIMPFSIKASYREPVQVRSIPGAATPTGAVFHAIRPGDTLSAVATRYGVALGDLASANHLGNTDELAVGENLVIPVSLPVPGNPLAGMGATRTLPWPVTGPVSSPFGEREIFGNREFHTGIDIAAPQGTPVRAVLAGRVVFAAPLGTYGLTVIIDHGDGFSTLYAHASRLVTATGQTVAAGQVIVLVGQTGDATGPHVHFETRVDGQPRDPMMYLR